MRVCLASDFYFPNRGGVEVHLHALATTLTSLGHHLIILTHYRPTHQGLHYFAPGFRVYYCPFHYFHNGITAPTFFIQMPLIRDILLRQSIEIVHTHQSSSPLAACVAIMGRELGCRLVHTEHSLFGSDDLASININKLLKVFMGDFDRFIGVSSVTRQNLILRGMLPPHKVHRIPNAIDTDLFYPQPHLRNSKITLVFLSRLVYRKGVDLLADLLPLLAQDFPHMHFIVGGNGPKEELLNTVVRQQALEQRVEMTSMVQHSQVPILLNRGHIFLNTSLTESFCMAVLEACACGLISVSTDVGGIAETIPREYLVLSTAEVPHLREAVAEAVRRVEGKKEEKSLQEVHRLIKKSYNWWNVGHQVEQVYKEVMEEEVPSKGKSMSRHFTGGMITGLLMLFMMVWTHILNRVLWRTEPISKRTSSQ